MRKLTIGTLVLVGLSLCLGSFPSYLVGNSMDSGGGMHSTETALWADGPEPIPPVRIQIADGPEPIPPVRTQIADGPEPIPPAFMVAA